MGSATHTNKLGNFLKYYKYYSLHINIQLFQYYYCIYICNAKYELYHTYTLICTYMMGFRYPLSLT